MDGSNELLCSFHGVGIKALGPTAIISALESRLGELRREQAGDLLTFEYATAGLDGQHAIEKPSGKGRPFYNPLVGEAVYYPDDDVMYLSYGHRARVLCRATEGHCRISLAEPELEQVWLGTHPLFTIPFIEMLKRRKLYSLHAASVALGEHCVLLAGTSGAGKSTLTLSHLHAGLSFMGDDMTFFAEGETIQALAFPEKVDITDTTASFFPELRMVADTPRRPGWPKHEVRPGDFFHSDVTWSANPAVIVFPRISDLKESKLIPMGSNEAFLELVSNVLLTHSAATKAHVSLIAQLAKTIPAYRLLAARDFNRVPDLLKQKLFDISAGKSGF